MGAATPSTWATAPCQASIDAKGRLLPYVVGRTPALNTVSFKVGVPRSATHVARLT